jgi:hypothetical protein
MEYIRITKSKTKHKPSGRRAVEWKSKKEIEISVNGKVVLVLKY